MSYSVSNFLLFLVHILVLAGAVFLVMKLVNLGLAEWENGRRPGRGSGISAIFASGAVRQSRPQSVPRQAQAGAPPGPPVNQQQGYPQPNNQPLPAGNPPLPAGNQAAIPKRSLGLLIIFSLLTLGIYSIYWWYKYAEDVNRIAEGDGEHTTNYLLCIVFSFLTLGIYGLYWQYKIANRIYFNATRYGTQVAESGSTILLWILLGGLFFSIGYFVALYFMVKNMNTLATAYNARLQQG
jgi:hypothetical protein